MALLLAACQTAPSSLDCREFQRQYEPAADSREADPMLDTGLMLKPVDADNWGLHLLLPVTVGWTTFDLADGISLSDLATVAVVPTAEVIVPLSERWTLLPFVGVGGAWQTGASDLVGGREFIGLWTGGVRATRWQHFADRHWFGFTGEFRYDTAMTARDGVLGDWGKLDAALELRRDFGAPCDEPRFEGGVYAQGTWFWDETELDISGISPPTVDYQVELGVSLGSTRPVKVLGITLPHVFIGYFTGDGLSGVRVHFARL